MIEIQKDNYVMLNKIQDFEERLEECSDEEPEKMIGEQKSCLICSFECVCEITLQKHFTAKHWGIPKDKSGNEIIKI